ncbi:helix-turn-helix transcriptional regulator [Paenibacillus alvei]|uniref:Helix-turn-helix transcriptional regulator n=1 Tax=Paenibacillus alvei TaxID=44250 RepID=A0ABT4H2S6_PAEAL|nr:helix-turn-helix transcriptional regulator [Paenibacillus alvei]EJW13781.1 putative transcriptional regulator with C-terminal CBS domains [Paenibacillus alvei DSM 29]MCY9540512.1 helix-turn-helix transcriptional regulator [Paenibacillus alvei]MCY9708284.1 helix-turn-helix transcriptional regulator [Paenibacillus alvei]MCY9732921.1 helix-turn-helix transcriptional regulator [Paenibacillus alvei]MCY9755205.1 helix-turn-helix transcriptional regulator [Paenibacillus alvei]
MKRWDDVKKSISSVPEIEKEVLEFTAYLVAKLVQRRHELGLTQEEVAQKTGLKQSAIARIENARIVPKVDTIQIIAKALGLSLDLVSNEEAAALSFA